MAKQRIRQLLYNSDAKQTWQERMKKTVCLFLFALLFFSSNMAVMRATQHKIEIKILATSDMHNTFYPYDYARDEAYNNGSLARVASVLKDVRTDNTVLIDNGDTIQGIASHLNMKDDISPMMRGMNALGYDVWSSGNHEFNYGIPFLEKTVATFNGQFLLSNVYDSAGNRLRGASNYTIVERSGVKIAVIGVVTPNITRWDKTNLEGYTVTDPKTEVARAVEEIQAGHLADLTVVSFHASVGGEYEGLTDSAATIVREVPHIDALIAGHEHSVVGQVIQGKTNPVPVVEPGRFGDYVSEITLNVEFQDGKYRVSNYEEDIAYRNIRSSDYESDEQMLSLLAPYHERARTDAQTVIGELRNGPLVRAPEIKGIAQAQIEDTPLIDLILKVQLADVESRGVIPQGARHVSGAALFNENANIQPGTITKAGTSRIYRFDNTLMTLKTTGAGLKQYMEWSANYYNQFKAGDLTISFNPDVRIYNYDMFGGVKYKVNIDKPTGARIEALTYNDGVSVNDTDEVYITVNNYRANTHLLGRILPAGAQVVYDSANEERGSVRDKITDYITKQKTIYPEVDQNWEVVGYDWHADLHDVVGKLVTRGDLRIPKSADGRTPNVRPIRKADIVAHANVIDLLSINDFHGAVEENGKNIGGAKLGAVIKQKKKENEQTYLLGGGDLFQGSAISNLTKGKVVSALLKEYGLLYSAVGNHEFDWNVETIPEMARNGDFTFLAANIVLKDDGVQNDAEQGKPYAILEVGGKRIGLIGLTTTSTAYQTVPRNVAHLHFLDPVATAKKWERHLRAVEGVDLVFALTHLSSEHVGDNIEGEASELAQGVPTLDGIFSAHSHRFVEGYVNNVPIVQGGYNGRGISNISIIYAQDGEKLAVVPVMENLGDKVDTLPEDEASKQIIEQYRTDLAPILDEVIGTNAQDLPHERIPGENITPMGQATAKMMQELAGADLTVVNGGGIRAGLEAGDITVGDMYRLFPFDNTLVSADVTGRDLKQIIEHGINPPDFRPGQFYGLNVWYDLDEDGQPHVSSMRLLNGDKIEDAQTYRVATLDFLLAGGDRYDFSRATNTTNTGTPLREALMQHIKSNKGIKHQFYQALVRGTDSGGIDSGKNDEKDKGTGDKLISTGTYAFEFVTGSVLLIAFSVLYLHKKTHASLCKK